MTDIPIIGGVLGSLFFKKPKQPKIPQPQPQITPRNESPLASALRSRKGNNDNRRTGSGGAESAVSGKNKLMGR